MKPYGHKKLRIPPRIVFFDGVCNLCNRSVRFVLTRDLRKKFYFSHLQSSFARDFLSKFQLSPDLDSVILYLNGGIYTKSTAILLILKELNGFWFLFSLFRIIPSFFRDALYDYIAKKRYNWFGKQERCLLPTTELSKRFLE